MRTYLPILLLLGACAPTAQLTLSPSGDWLSRAAPLTSVPDEYRQWWDSLGVACKCEAKTPFESIAFYRVPGAYFHFPTRRELSRAIYLEGPDIVIADHWLLDRRVVEHELLHARLHSEQHSPLFRQLGLLSY